jgi:hypothetical protein
MRKAMSNAINELNKPVLFTIANAKAAAIAQNTMLPLPIDPQRLAYYRQSPTHMVRVTAIG